MATIHCHLVIAKDAPEALVCFVARHLTELLADAFVTAADNIALRVDRAPPSQHFVGGRLLDSLPPCLITIHHPQDARPGNIAVLQRAIRHLLSQTFDAPVLDSQIRFAPMDLSPVEMTTASTR